MTEEEARRRIVLSMCPERVCRTCGEPSRRILGDVEYVGRSGKVTPAKWMGSTLERGRPQEAYGMDSGGFSAVRPTLGFTDCGHDDWRPGVVLDPFLR